MIAKGDLRSENCMVCGKVMPVSATWGPEWLVRTFCSRDCSESRLAPLDYRLQEAVLQLLGRQSEGERLNLEDVARFVDPLGWESLMERTRNAARRLVAQGALTIEGSATDEAIVWESDEMRLRLPN